MSNKIYEKAIPALIGSDGVIICDYDINYSQEVAVRLEKFAQTQASNNLDIKIYSISPHSLYVDDQISIHIREAEEIFDSNSEEFKEIYKQVPHVYMFVKENYENGAFYSEKFTDTLGEIIEYVSDHI